MPPHPHRKETCSQQVSKHAKTASLPPGRGVVPPTCVRIRARGLNRAPTTSASPANSPPPRHHAAAYARRRTTPRAAQLRAAPAHSLQATARRAPCPPTAPPTHTGSTPPPLSSCTASPLLSPNSTSKTAAYSPLRARWSKGTTRPRASPALAADREHLQAVSLAQRTQP
ncbi:hypothetical protein C8J57DRAFT_1503516 [Mycena rebaudengoi]|nr:hypothetical protein C8J57DRAFT_1503516 [Mycena rebaudengoi]